MSESASHRFEFHHHQQASRQFFELREVARPAKADTQWLSLRFRSEAMQRHSPGSHFAIVLRAHLARDEAGVPCSVSGRGLAWGDTSQAFPPAQPHPEGAEFGGSRGVVVESFWPGGNFLYRVSAGLTDGLCDDRDYELYLQVNDAGDIAYRISVADGSRSNAPVTASVRDAKAHPVTPNRSGVVIALGRDPAETGPWSALFSEIRCGWF